MSDETEFSPEELRAWQKDPRGKIFWDTLREMLAEGILDMRAAIRANKIHDSTRYGSHVETIEEVLILPGKIIEDLEKEIPEKEMEKA